jgi:hypothetical protein
LLDQLDAIQWDVKDSMLIAYNQMSIFDLFNEEHRVLFQKPTWGLNRPGQANVSAFFELLDLNWHWSFSF